MGLFDEVRYQGELWQTKSLDCQMQLFEVDETGQLFREHYDIEDRSDPTAQGIRRLLGSMTRVNRRMMPEPYTGEIRLRSDESIVVLWMVNGQKRDSVTLKEEA